MKQCALITVIGCFLRVGLVLGYPSTTEEPESCSFPVYLTRRPKWETKIQNERRSTGMFVRFMDTTMSVTDFSKMSPEVTLYDVTQCFDGGKYLLKIRDQEKYTCVGITQSSHYVLQWRMSKPMDSPSSMLCEDGYLQHEEWPLVWPILEKGHYETCPLPGGYDIQIFDKEQKQLCKNYWMSPRLENECMQGEGMQLNFRHFDCKGNLGMHLKQTLFCLGTWQSGDYMYSVLSNGDELWPKLWLTRSSIKAKDQNTFNMKIFQDIVGEASETPVQTNRFYTWTLTKGGEEPVCADEASVDKCAQEGAVLEECDKVKKIYCMKSCNACDSLKIKDKCEFPEDIQGKWTSSNVYMEYNFQLTVNNTVSLYAKDDVTNFHCLNTDGSEWLKHSHRYPVVATFDNGCKPRYACLEAETKGPNILSYRLSQSAIWPVDVSPEGMCRDEVYSNDKGPLWNIIRSVDKQMLVSDDTENDEHKNVECSFKKETFLNPADDRYGWSSIKTNDPDKSVIVNTTCLSELDPNYSNKTFLRNEWRCLSKFENGNSRFLIVESESMDTSPRIQCWITHQNGWSPLVYLYAVYPSDCNDAISKHIQFDGYAGHLAAYTIDSTMTNSNMPCIIDDEPVVRPSTSPLPSSSSVNEDDSDSTVGKTLKTSTEGTIAVRNTTENNTHPDQTRTETISPPTQIKSTVKQLVTQNIPPSENSTNTSLYHLEVKDKNKNYSSSANHVVHSVLTEAIIIAVIYIFITK